MNSVNNELLDRVPPQNLEAEQSLLGALLIDKHAIEKIADLIHTEDFYKDTHAMVFESMNELYEKNEPLDVLTVSSRLEEKQQLEKIGGRSYLATLAGIVPTSAHVEQYARIIQKKSTLRRLLGAASEISRLGHAEDEDMEYLLDEAEQKLFGVSQRFLKRAFVPIKDILSEAFERIDELHRNKGQLRGLRTGFGDLDNILAGLQKSDLIIIAARPSVGKTSLALDIARNVGTKGKKSVAVFSLEMSKEQLVDRLLCSEAGVDLWRMRTGKLSDSPSHDDFPRIGHAMGVLSEAQIHIDDSAMTNVMEIRTKARRLKSEKGLDLIIIDYLQLLEGHGSDENRVQEVAKISRALKGIARELDIPVIALSQLSRAVEARSPAIPKLSDLRESGSIEQDADIVIFLYRKKMDKSRESAPEDENTAEIHIAKHRNGPTGMVKLYFDGQTVSFKNLDKSYGDFAPPPTVQSLPPQPHAPSTPLMPTPPIPAPNVGF